MHLLRQIIVLLGAIGIVGAASAVPPGSSPAVDLSPYATTAQVAAAVAPKANASDVTTLSGQVAANTASLNPLANAYARWDASALSGLADGAPVSVLPDSTARGVHLYQQATASQPTKATDVAGNTVVRFTGAQSLRALGLGAAEPTLAPLTGDFSLAMVVRPSATQNNTAPFLFSSGGAALRIWIDNSTGAGAVRTDNQPGASNFTGDVTSGSPVIKNVSATTFPGLRLSGSGIPSGATVLRYSPETATAVIGVNGIAAAASLTGTTSNNSTSLTNVTSSLAVGSAIAGAGIPSGTTVTAFSGTTATLSQAATATASLVPLAVGSVPITISGFGNSGALWMPSIADGNLHLIQFNGDQFATDIYLDGYWVSYAPTPAVQPALSTPAFGFYTTGNSNFYTGDLADAAIWNRKLNATDLLAAARSLNTKWGIGLAALDNTLAGTNIYGGGTTPDGAAIRTWTPAKPSSDPTLLIFVHPANGSSQVTPDYFAYPGVRAALGLGWYVAASDLGFSGSPGFAGGVANHWGNPTAQTSLRQLYDLMAARIGKTPKVVLWGCSMGGLTSALATVKGTLPAGVVKAVYLEDAVFDLWAFYKSNASYGSQIDAAYGAVAGTLSAAPAAGATSISSSVSYAAGTVIAIDPNGTGAEQATVTGTSGSAAPYTLTLSAGLANAHASGVKVSDYPTKTAGNDPMLQPVTAWAGLPVHFYAGTGDTLVAQGPHTNAYQAKIAVTAKESGITQHVGGHLVAPSARDLIEFAKRNLSYGRDLPKLPAAAANDNDAERLAA